MFRFIEGLKDAYSAIKEKFDATVAKWSPEHRNILEESSKKMADNVLAFKI